MITVTLRRNDHQALMEIPNRSGIVVSESLPDEIGHPFDVIPFNPGRVQVRES